MKKFVLKEGDYFKTEGLSQEEYEFLVGKFIKAGAGNSWGHGSGRTSWRRYDYIVYHKGDLCTGLYTGKAGKREVILEDFPEYQDGVLKNTLKPAFPDFDFIIDCGDNPAVRQWLKDNGCCWVSGRDIVENPPKDKYLLVEGKRVTSSNSAFCENEFSYQSINVSVEVTGYTKVVPKNDSLKDQLKKLEEEQRKIADQMRDIQMKVIQDQLENK